MKRGSSLVEKCQSKLQQGTTSHWSEGSSRKSLQITNAAEGVEKRKPPTWLMGMQTGAATMENSMEFP